MKMKKPLVIIGAIVVVLLLIVLCLPLFINVNQFKPEIETKLNAALGRNVTIGNISLSILSGGVTVDDVAISDDPGFSKLPFLTAKSIGVGVELIPLIFSKQLNVESITVDSPDVNLIQHAGGKWNYSSLGGSSASSKSPKAPGNESAPPPLSVKKLKIKNGKIVVSTAGAGQKPSVYQSLDLEVSDLSPTTQFPFKLSVKGPGNGDIKVEGKAGPMNPSDPSMSPLNATVDVQHLDLANTGFIEPSSGVAGLLDFKGTANSDGKQLNSKGTIKVNKLKASPKGSPSSVPVIVDYSTVFTMQTRAGVLNQCDIKIGNAVQHLTGTYNAAGDPPKLDMKLSAPGMPLGDLEGFLPAVGVELPPGSKLKGGTLSVNMTIVGPADKPTITGPINLSNAKIEGFSVKSKLGALGSFPGLGGGGGGGGNDTDIQTVSANVRNDPSGTKIENLDIVLPSIGTVTGNGTVSAAGQLNFKMVANLAGGMGKVVGGVGTVAGGATGAMSSLVGGGHSGGSSSSGGIPFTVTGTTSNPQVLPDVGGAVGSVAMGAAGNVVSKPKGAVTGGLGGLLGKKKP